MSGYTSGRTVKSSRATVSPTAAATATGRRLAKRHLPTTSYPQISSKKVAGTDGTVRMKTEILFAEMALDTTRQLADAVSSLPGYHSMCWTAFGLSYLIELEA